MKNILIKNNQLELIQGEEGFIRLTWTESCKDIFTRELNKERKKIEQIISDKDINDLLIDISNCRFVDKEDVKWYPNLLLSQYDKTNIQQIAIILPTTFKLEHTQNQIIEDEPALVVRFFISEKEAVEWLRTNKTYHA